MFIHAVLKMLNIIYLTPCIIQRQNRQTDVYTYTYAYIYIYIYKYTYTHIYIVLSICCHIQCNQTVRKLFSYLYVYSSYSFQNNLLYTEFYNINVPMYVKSYVYAYIIHVTVKVQIICFSTHTHIYIYIYIYIVCHYLKLCKPLKIEERKYCFIS